MIAYEIRRNTNKNNPLYNQYRSLIKKRAHRALNKKMKSLNKIGLK